ncbi:MAG: PTS system mannose/fructose/sorbose family transporter subunit IID [Lachnospiraceae bacterium]|jgi:PTS system mannose-specific IID component|nr:PTS system mannose/fructose/sorbose family transporter subunit IID [Lachnospiraceae bacterium]
MSEERKVKRASKKAVMKSFLNWIFMAHGCYNYERLQGVGFLHAMCPIIDDIYDKDDIEGRKKAMQRHTAFFNTEPRLGSMIVGLSAAMEERIASGEEELAGEAMTSIKNGLMGPISGIGDTFMQAILSPLLLSMALGLAVSGNVLGPILYMVLFISIVAILGYECFMLGYKRGDEAILNFIESGVINKIISGAGIMGCTVMGALVANFVSMKATVTFEMTTGIFDLQTNFFDAIMPKLLPLALTLLVYQGMKKKDISALKMMLILIVAGGILGALGIIG